jgi:hypothetical protein
MPTATPQRHFSVFARVALDFISRMRSANKVGPLNYSVIKGVILLVSESSSSSKSSLIIGVVIGVAAGIIVIIILLTLVVGKRRLRQQRAYHGSLRHSTIFEFSLCST